MLVEIVKDFALVRVASGHMRDLGRHSSTSQGEQNRRPVPRRGLLGRSESGFNGRYVLGSHASHFEASRGRVPQFPVDVTRGPRERDWIDAVASLNLGKG